MAKEDIFTIEQVARAVWISDGYTGELSAEQIAHILELALKNRIGLACRVANGVSVDLGNGHMLNCTLQKA